MMSRSETLAALAKLGWWYQHFAFPNGVRTGDGQEPGYLPETRWNLFKEFIPERLDGKSVLDVGGNAGYFSIQMKLRGAARCVLVDPYREFIAQARFAAAQFDVHLELVTEDVLTYCLTTDERFDYVLFLGLFYHLRHPVIVLDRLAEMTRQRLVLASAVAGPPVEPAPPSPNHDRSEDQALLEDPAHPKLVFIENRYYGDPTNWWLPNHAALPALVRSAGMNVIARPHSHLLVAEPAEYFGKVVYDKLVLPRYGKRGEQSRHPGPQNVDPGLWAELTQRAQEALRRQSEESR